MNFLEIKTKNNLAIYFSFQNANNNEYESIVEIQKNELDQYIWKGKNTLVLPDNIYIIKQVPDGYVYLEEPTNFNEKYDLL